MSLSNHVNAGESAPHVEDPAEALAEGDGAKRAVTFAEHIYENVLEDVPQRHIVFTIPKRLRPFFKYDRALLSILFKAAWKALSEVLGIDQRELGAVITVQTAGKALNYSVVSLSNHTLTFTV